MLKQVSVLTITCISSKNGGAGELLLTGALHVCPFVFSCLLQISSGKANFSYIEVPELLASLVYPSLPFSAFYAHKNIFRSVKPIVTADQTSWKIFGVEMRVCTVSAYEGAFCPIAQTLIT